MSVAVRAAIHRELDSCKSEVSEEQYKKLKCVKCDEYRIFLALLEEHEASEDIDGGAEEHEEAETLIKAYEKENVDLQT